MLQAAVKAGVIFEAHASCGSSDPDDESSWLRCDQDVSDTLESLFEVSPSSPGRVKLKSLANERYLEMAPPGDPKAWVVRAVLRGSDADGETRSRAQRSKHVREA